MAWRLREMRSAALAGPGRKPARAGLAAKNDMRQNERKSARERATSHQFGRRGQNNDRRAETLLPSSVTNTVVLISSNYLWSCWANTL